MCVNMYLTHCLRKYYTDIHEYPVTKYFNINGKKDFKFLLLPGKKKVDRFAAMAFDRINDQIVDEFGVNPEYMAVFEKKIKIEQLYAEQFASGRRTNQVMIEILEEEIKKLEKPKPASKSSVYDSMIAIEKIMGLKFEFEKISVFEFFTYAKHLNNRNNG